MNDATHAQQPAYPGEHLRPTMELRWVGPRYVHGRVSPERLQQKWISTNSDYVEWRDVPTVSES